MFDKMSKDQKQNFTDKIASVLSDKKPTLKECKICREFFKVNSPDSKLELCLPWKIKEDLKLPDDTIINMNVVNLWKAKNGKVETLDKLLLCVAEGIALIPGEIETRNYLTLIKMNLKKYDTKTIEKKLKKELKKAYGLYDAVLVFRFSPTDDFSIFKIRLSNRLVERFSDKSSLYVKKVITSLVIKNYFKKIDRQKGKNNR